MCTTFVRLQPICQKICQTGAPERIWTYWGQARFVLNEVYVLVLERMEYLVIQDRKANSQLKPFRISKKFSISQL